MSRGKYGGARMYARIYCIYHASSSSIMPGFCGRDTGHKALCPVSLREIFLGPSQFYRLVEHSPLNLGTLSLTTICMILHSAFCILHSVFCDERAHQAPHGTQLQPHPRRSRASAQAGAPCSAAGTSTVAGARDGRRGRRRGAHDAAGGDRKLHEVGWRC